MASGTAAETPSQARFKVTPRNSPRRSPRAAGRLFGGASGTRAISKPPGVGVRAGVFSAGRSGVRPAPTGTGKP